MYLLLPFKKRPPVKCLPLWRLSVREGMLQNSIRSFVSDYNFPHWQHEEKEIRD